MCRRPDVGVHNDHFFGSSSGCYHPDSFAPGCGFAGANMAWIEQNPRSAVQSFEIGGHLELASEPKIVVLDVCGKGACRQDRLQTTETARLRDLACD